MKLFIDVTGKSFMVTKEAVEKSDQNGRQKSERRPADRCGSRRSWRWTRRAAR